MVRFGQPDIAGEMLAGVILGPSCLALIHPNPALAAISELAVFLIVLSAGLEMSFGDVISAMRGRGLVVGLLGFFLPLAAGLLTGMAFGLDAMRTVFLGLTVSITALPVAVRILESFKLLDSNVAKYSVGTAVLNDLAALLALGVILDLPGQKGFEAIALSILMTGGKLLLLAGLILGANSLIRRMQVRAFPIERVTEKLISVFGSEALLGMLIAFVLVFASVSEILGFHFVVGAFFGALLVDKTFFLRGRFRDLEKSLNSVTSGFLAPVFFAYLGLEFNVATMSSPLFVVVVLIVSVLSKVLAGWMGGRIAKLSGPESWGLGIILNGRGVMGLVVASIAFERKFIGAGLFSTLVLMSLFTTLLAPFLFRRFVLPRMDTSVPTQAPGSSGAR